MNSQPRPARSLLSIAFGAILLLMLVVAIDIARMLDTPAVQSRLILDFSLGIGLAAILAIAVLLRVRRLEQAADAEFRAADLARREMADLARRLEHAQEDERKRLSRELHDEVGQSMSAMLVDLRHLENTIPPNEAIQTRFVGFRRQAEECVRSVRDMALLLRPSMLDDLGLVTALKWQGREVNRRTGLHVKVQAEDTGDELPDSVRTCVYRVVQEALNNCVKHAAASTVTVTLNQSDGSLQVTVADNGKGFDPKTEKGLGLLGMRERVSRLGGTLEVRSQPGAGAQLAVRLPLCQQETTV